MHTFQVDITPPIGDYLCGGFHSYRRLLHTLAGVDRIICTKHTLK